MIGFYHGSSLPAKESLKSGIYFIVNEGKGKLYRVLADATDAVLVAETTDASLIADVAKAKEDIQKNATSVAGAIASIKKITDLHGETLKNITDEASTIRGIAEGAASQAATNKAAHEKNAKDIKANADAISAIKDGANIDSFADVESALAGKEATGVAQNLVSAAKTELQGYADAAAKAVDDKLGFTPDETSATLKAYVDKKTADVATSSTITDIQGRLSKIEGDYLTSEEEKELTDAIALKANQTALEAEVSRADTEEKRIVGLVESEASRADTEEKRIVGLVEAEATKAREEEGKLSDRLDEVEAFFELAEGEKLDEALDTLVELQRYLETEGATADQMLLDIAANKEAIEAIEDDYLKAADKTELSGAIDDVAGRMTTAEGEIDALQAKFDGSGDGTVAKMIADAVAGEAALREAGDQAAEASAAAALTAAQGAQAAAEAADAKAQTAQNEVDALEEVVATKAAAADLTTLAGRVTTAEGKITTLEGEMDAAEGRLDAVEKKASDNTTAIGTNASNIEALMAALEWKQA